MRRHRWSWRIAAIPPAVVVLGLAGAGTAMASGGGSSPGTCTTSGGLLGTVVGGVCQTVQAVTSPLPLPSPSSILPSPGSIAPSPVASVVGSVGSAVGSTVGSLTGTSGSSGTSSGSTGSAGGASSGSTSRHSASKSSRHSQPATPAVGAVGTVPSAGVLSSLGIPGWLVSGGLGAPSGSTVPLSFPVVHPRGNGGSRTVAQQIHSGPQQRAVSSLWLVFAVGVACLVGVAGGLGRYEGRRRVRRIPG